MLLPAADLARRVRALAAWTRHPAPCPRPAPCGGSGGAQRERAGLGGDRVDHALVVSELAELASLREHAGVDLGFAEVDLVAVPAELPGDDDEDHARQVLGRAHVDLRRTQRAR